MNQKENEYTAFSSPVNRLTVHPGEEFFQIFSDGDVGTNEFQGIFEALLSEMEKHPFKKLVIDIEKMKSSTLAARTWLVLNFVPRFYSKYEGIYNVAIVNTKNFLEGIAIDLLAKAVMALGFKISISFHKDVGECKRKLGIG